MPDENAEAERVLGVLARRLRMGWAKQHPATDRQLERVREAVREQWEKEQGAQRAEEAARKRRSATPTPGPQQDPTRGRTRRDQGGSHGQDQEHGH